MYIHRIVIDANQINTRSGILAMNSLEVRVSVIDSTPQPEKDLREFKEVLPRRDLSTLMSAAWG